MCRLWHFPETLSLTHVKRRLLNTVLNRTHRRRTADRHMGVSECQWHSSCEPTEPTGEKQAQGITERLKEENALEWTGRLGNIRACAREIVNEEIIFA